MAQAQERGTVADLRCYPIRGMSGQHVQSVRLSPEDGFPYDRAWALARHDGDAVKLPDRPLASRHYHGPTYDPRLAGVRTHVDPESEELEVFVREHRVLRCSLSNGEGRAQAEELLARVLDLDPQETPRLIRRTRGDYNYTYTSSLSERLRLACHVVNLASVRELSERIGAEVDPLRFRANVYIDMGQPWVEREWLNHRLQLGQARLSVEMGTPRCAATEVNRSTAELDIPVPRLLKQHYGHTEMGFYAVVEAAGTVTTGGPVTVRAGGAR